MATILIVGCGKIGQPLARQLVLDGHRVIGVRRNPQLSRDPEISWIGADICDPEAVKRLPVEIDSMIIILTPAARSAQGYAQIYQQGLGNLLNHFSNKQRHPACFFVSATSVYAQQQGEWVDENSETLPLNYNGKSLLAGEQLVRGFSNCPIIVRFSGIYGGPENHLLNLLRQHPEQPLEIQRSPPFYTNRIHQEDCIGALYFLVSMQLGQQPMATTYIATDHDCAIKFELMTWLANRIGSVPPVPALVPPDSTQNKRCSNGRLLAAGYCFKYPSFKDGYTQSI